MPIGLGEPLLSACVQTSDFGEQRGVFVHVILPPAGNSESAENLWTG
jgi:hypothetical protein